MDEPENRAKDTQSRRESTHFAEECHTLVVPLLNIGQL